MNKTKNKPSKRDVFLASVVMGTIVGCIATKSIPTAIGILTYCVLIIIYKLEYN